MKQRTGIVSFLFFLMFIFLVTHTAVCENVDPVLSEERSSFLYSNISDSGIIVADDTVWYLEEFDTNDRPIRGTKWIKGIEDTTIIWEYDGTNERPIRSTASQKEVKILTDYNASGFVIKETTVTIDGKETMSRILMRDDNNRIISETITSSTGIVTTRFTFTDSGNILEKRIEKNGELVSISVYTDENNWTDTVYKKGEAVLSAIYINGKKIGKADILH